MTQRDNRFTKGLHVFITFNPLSSLIEIIEKQKKTYGSRLACLSGCFGELFAWEFSY